MRRGFSILGFGVIAAVIAYGCFYLVGTANSRQWLQSPQPELAWLKQEFKLSDSEFVRISQLHQAYLPQCRERCRRLNEMNDKLEQALAGVSGLTPEIENLLAERAKMRADCQAEMLKHFFEVSRTMPPAQGKRYLSWVQKQTCLREQTMDHAETPRAEAGAVVSHE